VTGARLEKPRGRYHHGDLRRALVAAAREVAREHGADAIALRDLARSLGVNHRSVYRHFADREALVTAVAVDGWSQLTRHLQEAGDTPEAPVHAMLGAYVGFALDNGGCYRAMVGPGTRSLGGSEELKSAVLGAIRVVEKEVAAQTGEDGAALRDRVFAIWGLAHGLCDLVLAGHARAASSQKARAWVLRLAEPLLEDAGLR